MIGHTLTILLKTDNLFESGADALVNAVNCVGVMGAGLAKAFRDKFPGMNDEYELYCRLGLLTPGEVHTYILDPKQGKYIINFPSKDDWRDPSKLEYIDEGIDALLMTVSRFKMQSVAVPALGCGLGGLEWSEVYNLLKDLDGNMPNVTWMIYPPQ